jgi:hypothetical protein
MVRDRRDAMLTANRLRQRGGHCVAALIDPLYLANRGKLGWGTRLARSDWVLRLRDLRSLRSDDRSCRYFFISAQEKERGGCPRSALERSSYAKISPGMRLSVLVVNVS